MAAEGQQPRVQVINLETGTRQVLGNFPDMASSPRFAPDGQRIVMSLQQGGNANIFMMDLGSRNTTRLTSTAAIDTSPASTASTKRARSSMTRTPCHPCHRFGGGPLDLRARALKPTNRRDADPVSAGRSGSQAATSSEYSRDAEVLSGSKWR